MNHSVIRFILGYVIGFMGIFLMLPIVVALIYREDVWIDYAIVAVPCLVIGILNSYFKPKQFSFYLKEGFFCTGASWAVLSVIGALPLYLSDEIPHYIDALFEAVSGFTTTGASILGNAKLHSSCWWYGSFGIPAYSYSTGRWGWFSVQPDEGRITWSICRKAGSKA